MSGGEVGTETGALQEATSAAEAQPNEPVEKGATGCPTRPPPQVCPAHIAIEALNPILVAEGEAVTLKVLDPAAGSGVEYEWQTSSTNLQLTSLKGKVITVRGTKDVSRGLNAETVKVTRRSPDGCPVLTAETQLTVARVTFGKSGQNKYGYDDMDSKPRWYRPQVAFHYVSIKAHEKEAPVHVLIEGGPTAKHFDFACASGTPKACKPIPPEPGLADFDLMIQAGTQQPVQVLQAFCKQPAQTLFAEIGLCVYEEQFRNIVIGKFYRTKPLRNPKLDYVGKESDFNTSLREAVVKFKVHNFTRDGSPTKYDFLSGNSTMVFDIAAHGGPDREELQRIMSGAKKIDQEIIPGTKDMVRVAIVRDLRSYYYLSKAAKKGDTCVHVRGDHVYFNNNDSTVIGHGATEEPLVMKSVIGGKIMEVEKLKKDHPEGDPIAFPAGAWSTDPIIIQEGNAGDEITLWTMPHEVSHREFKLLDVNDKVNIMHFQQGLGQTHLRYKPRPLHYDATKVQRQWELIHGM